ncbi:PKD domain-containing protein [Candidatus Peregrinibacteria bacterium]|nr:PKD domain-containing protein [Candidatus Peregrinibacteria bacterium]
MKKILKIKILSAILLLALSFGFAVSLNTEPVSAIDEFWDIFETEDQTGLSFTEYQGELAALEAEGYEPALTTSSDLREFIITIVNYALSFLGLVAVLFVIYGGVLYVTSAGEEEKTTQGKKVILYAAIGLLIVLGSFAFVNTVIGAAGGNQSSVSTTASPNTGGGFNSSSEQVKTIAVNVYNGFSYLAETTEELKNIQADAGKSSLDPLRLPAKSDILSFLYSVQAKFNNISNLGYQFSEANAEITNQLREISQAIDRIKSLNAQTYARISNGTIDYCDPSDDKDAVDVIFGLNPCEASGYFQYPIGLFESWQPLREQFIAGTGDQINLNKIATLISDDYYLNLKEYLGRLELVHEEVKNIEPIAVGAANTAYIKMKEAYGYESITLADEAGSNDYEIHKAGGENFLSLIRGWQLGEVGETPITLANQYLTLALRFQSDFYNELNDLEYVQARLTANTVEGSAPLTVLFDALATVDPAGGSLDPSNIVWDLSGQLTTAELLGAEDYGQPPVNNEYMTCELTAPSEQSEREELIGSTSQRCTFDKPGTYRAAIKIRSNDPTKYAPGISVLTVRVKPRTTKINLDVTPLGGETQNIISYAGDILLNDKRSLTVTLSEAENGITFDASKTDADQFKWSFGNGDSTGYSTNAIVENYRGYESAGKYEVTLEVLSRLGVLDRKVFTLEVSSLAARLKTELEGEALINSPVVFDGTGSKSDTGSIREYSWEITPVDNVNLPPEAENYYPFENSGPNLNTIIHEFRYPVEYNITLTIIDDNGNRAVDSITDFKVTSEAPEALYTYEISDITQPGTVHFDGSKSFDPDGNDDYLNYEWKIDAPDETYRYLDDTTSMSERPIVKFLEKGDYEVSLKVTDTLTAAPTEESDTENKIIKIEKALDVAWGDGMEVTNVLDEDGNAQIEFLIESENAIAYEMDFGNGDRTTGDINGQKTVPYTYTEGGKYEVRLTVFNEDDEDNSISRRVFIGGGDKPLAKINISVDGVRVDDLGEIIEADKKNIITFDAGQSKNTDGTGRLLLYSWDFGDTNKSSNKVATHSYDELSPRDPGYFEVKLRVIDKENPNLIDEDSIKIKIVPKPPEFASIQGIPRSVRGDMTTPITVNMKAYGAEDPDGKITQYKWWYFDVDDPDEVLGLQITSTDTAQLVIGTNGPEGEEITYGFGLEVTDSDNLKFSSEELYSPGETPGVTVVNGPNELPFSRFNVSATKVFTGEEVTFNSASSDPDGNIVEYIWDFEGDGFFNNTPTDQATVKHIYTEKNISGYDVKLKVIDDKGGEAISLPIKIYVDVIAEPPVAAFTYEEVEGSDGKEIQFINNSTADENADAEIISYRWDFDTDSSLPTADSNGDGIKDNDADAFEAEPSHSFLTYGDYNVSLTITDSYGNTDSVTNTVMIVNPNPPIEEEPVEEEEEQEYETVTGMTATLDGYTDTEEELEPQGEQLLAKLSTNPPTDGQGVIYLNGDSAFVTFDFSQSTGLIQDYVFDKNIYFDIDGNGIKNDDIDFKTTLPGSWTTNFSNTGDRIVVKLTVIDIYGNQNSVTREIKFN